MIAVLSQDISVAMSPEVGRCFETINFTLLWLQMPDTPSKPQPLHGQVLVIIDSISAILSPYTGAKKGL